MSLAVSEMGKARRAASFFCREQVESSFELNESYLQWIVNAYHDSTRASLRCNGWLGDCSCCCGRSVDWAPKFEMAPKVREGIGSTLDPKGSK
jgi:hypothetical protein